MFKRKLKVLRHAEKTGPNRWTPPGWKNRPRTSIGNRFRPTCSYPSGSRSSRIGMTVSLAVASLDCGGKALA